MTPLELAADVLARNLEFVKFTLADFTDAEMLVRPVPGANHAAWQLGHLAAAESRMVEAVTPGAGGKLPAGFAEKFGKDTAASDDAKAFPSKAEIVDAFAKARMASVAWVKTLTPADLDRPTPEKMQQFVPTVGHMALMLLDPFDDAHWTVSGDPPEARAAGNVLENGRLNAKTSRTPS